MPGRKLLLQSCGPTTGLPGHITTKPGRFWLSHPRPYRSHEPIDGRTGWVSPHVIIRSDGSWFGTFVCIERITHNSSAHSPTFGYSSETSIPALPYFLKANGDCIRLPVRRSVLMSAGAFWPLYFVRAGFGSNVSTWDGPPFMNRWMTCLARGLKCGGFGASGLVPAAKSRWSSRRAARPRVPRPVPTRASIWRREIGNMRRDPGGGMGGRWDVISLRRGGG